MDCRTLEAQGIDREPTIHLDPAAAEKERRDRPQLGDSPGERQAPRSWGFAKGGGQVLEETAKAHEAKAGLLKSREFPAIAAFYKDAFVDRTVPDVVVPVADPPI